MAVIILISDNAVTDPGLLVCVIEAVDRFVFTAIAGAVTRIGPCNPTMSRMITTGLSTVAYHHKTAGDSVLGAVVDRPTWTSRPHDNR